jgi:hypothetical protein
MDAQRASVDRRERPMNPIAILLYPFDWRGVLSRADYRRNFSILVLTGALIKRLGLLPEAYPFVWTAIALAIGLSFDARRYHVIGRSAAWIVWANLIAAALAIVVFQFVPNAFDYIPLPEGWRPDAAGQAVLGRLALPALVGVLIGNVAQSLFLASAPSVTGDNPFARPAAARRREIEDRDDKPDEAALQAMIDRHMASRQVEPGQAASAPLRRHRAARAIAPPYLASANAAAVSTSASRVAPKRCSKACRKAASTSRIFAPLPRSLRLVTP